MSLFGSSAGYSRLALLFGDPNERVPCFQPFFSGFSFGVTSAVTEAVTVDDTGAYGSHLFRRNSRPDGFFSMLLTASLNRILASRVATPRLSYARARLRDNFWSTFIDPTIEFSSWVVPNGFSWSNFSSGFRLPRHLAAI